MMWLNIKNENQEIFAPISDRITLGSAASNGLVLDFKGIRPLHGQFLVEKDAWKFRSFAEDKEISIRDTQRFQIGSFEAALLESSNFQKTAGVVLFKAFQDVLKAQPHLASSEVLQELQRRHFLSKPLPEGLRHQVESRFAEFSLLGPIERMLADPEVTDIIVEAYDCIWIEKAGVYQKSQEAFTNEGNFKIYIENLLSRIQKAVDEAYPYLDFVLPDGSRGHLIGPPLTPSSFYLSIRKPRQKLFKLEELLDREMLSVQTYELLKQAVDKKWNLLISGCTGSGKTTLLKSIINQVPVSERILVLEDTPELELGRPNTAFLRTRIDIKGQLPSVSLRDLVKQSLRMRPDRIIVGEVRGPEALDLMQSMNTGHQGCMGSLHANSVRDALFRMEGLLQMSDDSLSESVSRQLIARNIHLLLHCDRANGKRRVTEVGIVRGLDQNQILLEVIS